MFVCVTSALLSGAKVRRKSHSRKETVGAGGILKLKRVVCQRVTEPEQMHVEIIQHRDGAR